MACVQQINFNDRNNESRLCVSSQYVTRISIRLNSAIKECSKCLCPSFCAFFPMCGCLLCSITALVLTQLFLQRAIVSILSNLRIVQERFRCNHLHLHNLFCSTFSRLWILYNTFANRRQSGGLFITAQIVLMYDVFVLWSEIMFLQIIILYT